MPWCYNNYILHHTVTSEVFMSVVVTCICAINNLDGSRCQIYYSVHFKESQVFLIQSNVSQKGS